MSTRYVWTGETRVVPKVGRRLAEGDEFEAEDWVGASLVAQGLAKRAPARTKPTKQLEGGDE